jgi:hypothetical protein
VLGFQQYILHIIYVANIARRNFLKEGPAWEVNFQNFDNRYAIPNINW